MKILFTISYYAPYISGLTIHVQRIAQALAKRGHVITILTSQYEKQLAVFETVENVSIIRVPYMQKISKGFIMPSYITNAYKAVKERQTIVINLPQAEGFIPAIFAKLLKKRLFCIYHCEVTLPRNSVNILITHILHAANIISLLLADTVITYTEDFAKHSKLLRFVKHKLVFIYPPVPKPVEDVKIEETFEKKLPKTKAFRIGIAARIAAEKGIEYLLETIPYLTKKLDKPVLLLIAGPKNPVGEEAYWQKITPLLKRFDKQLIFLGTLSSREMGPFYKLLDVLVLPSTNSTESFGMVQVEAMLCGIPVVASNLPGVRVPIAKTGMGEIAKVKDSSDLGEKIVQVLQNKKQYIKNPSTIAGTFSFNQTSATYEKLFTSIS